MRSTFAVRETASLGIMGAPRVPPLCRETQSLGQQMLNAPFGINGLKIVKVGNNVTILIAKCFTSLTWKSVSFFKTIPNFEMNPKHLEVLMRGSYVKNVIDAVFIS